MTNKGFRAPISVMAGVIAISFTAQAQPITVPNFSFESQAAPPIVPYVNGNVDSWSRHAEPAYWVPLTGGGIPWNGTSGLFLDVNPYGNTPGDQAGYVLNFPGAALFTHASTLDWNNSPSGFNSIFEIGKAYTLTIGVFGKDTITPGGTLKLSLFYMDGANQVDAASTTITYSAAQFPMSNLNLIDFNVNLTHVAPTDAWAGQNIGIKIESTSEFALMNQGNWDIDNVRLTAVPEPSTFALLGLGVAGLAYRSIRARRRA